MPNAILRAAGANCANDISSTRWPWVYLAETDKVVIKHTGWEVVGGGSESPTSTTTEDSSSESETLTSSSFSKRRSTSTNREAQVEVSLRFTYQAFKDFDITIEYSGSVSSGSPSIIAIDGGDSSTTGSFSKTETITLPRAVKPASVSAFITAQATGYPYANYPDVNPIDKSVSAGITITLINPL
tara:strand:+ start:572 stop:1126 length:555 start_codon:yes stop_codon:yes gene_type:complete